MRPLARSFLMAAIAVGLWIWIATVALWKLNVSLELQNNQKQPHQHLLRAQPAVKEKRMPASAPIELLSTVEMGCTATADVRGNLGPASTVLNDGTDWIKDRWQAASNMHGKAIQGEHWVVLEWKSATAGVEIHSIVLDWEAAFADNYQVQIQPLTDNGGATDEWTTVLEAPRDIVHTEKKGQSPGVKDPQVPLHVVHTLKELDGPPFPTTRLLRILINHPSQTGWGVSLWRVLVYGRVIAT